MTGIVATRGCCVGYAVPRAGVPATVSFQRWLSAALAAVQAPSDAGCSVRLVGSREGRALNRQWRQRDYATNVLSFPAAASSDSPSESPWLGDIVLCAPVVQSEARAQRKRTRDHYAHLTVHGVLHLLGHDHERPSEARVMERIERRILADLGIEDPYAVR